MTQTKHTHAQMIGVAKGELAAWASVDGVGFKHMGIIDKANRSRAKPASGML